MTYDVGKGAMLTSVCCSLPRPFSGWTGRSSSLHVLWSWNSFQGWSNRADARRCPPANLVNAPCQWSASSSAGYQGKVCLTWTIMNSCVRTDVIRWVQQSQANLWHGRGTKRTKNSLKLCFVFKWWAASWSTIHDKWQAWPSIFLMDECFFFLMLRLSIGFLSGKTKCADAQGRRAARQCTLLSPSPFQVYSLHLGRRWKITFSRLDCSSSVTRGLKNTILWSKLCCQIPCHDS